MTPDRPAPSSSVESCELNRTHQDATPPDGPTDPFRPVQCKSGELNCTNQDATTSARPVPSSSVKSCEFN